MLFDPEELLSAIQLQADAHERKQFGFQSGQSLRDHDWNTFSILLRVIEINEGVQAPRRYVRPRN